MWSNVELLLAEDTGTVRLGADSSSSSALYQLDTLLRLSPTGQVPSRPRLFSSSCPHCCLVACDTAVVLFDPGFQSVLLHLYFDTLVDAVDVCSKGKFLVVGERNGNLHLIYVPQQKILLSRVLQQGSSDGEESTYKSLILQEVQNSGGYDLFLTVHSGFLHVANLALGEIEKAITSLDVRSLNELQGAIRTEFYSTADLHHGGCTSSLISHHGNKMQLLIGGDGERSLSVWTMDCGHESMSLRSSLDSMLLPGVRKMEVVDNVMYVLNKENMLSSWDLHLLVMLCCWPDLSVQDFLLVTEGDSASLSSQEKSSMKIITLSINNEHQVRRLQVQSLPDLDILYSLDVSSVSCLVQKTTSPDTIYLLEEISGNLKSDDGDGSAVVMRCLTESLPEKRLNRLLYKHQFEEAENFAAAFGLDMELVYKVKLDFILEKLASVPFGEHGQVMWSELVEEAKSNLLKIMDEDYVVHYCLSALWPSIDAAEEMLNFASSRFPSSEIHVALAKLATFCSVHGPDNFDGVSWIEFLNSDDYLKDVLNHLRVGDLTGAQHLWLRHEGEISTHFDEDSLRSLLAVIPSTVPSPQLRLWLKVAVVPFVWRTLPDGRKILAWWLEQRARNLELTEKSDWPHNGLLLAELGLPPFWMSEEECGDEDLQQLRVLVLNLQQLCDLYRKYNCRLSLSDFEMGSIRSVAFLMLDKVLAPELVPDAIETAVRPYALEHKLDLDETLLLYIKDVLQCSSSSTTTLFTEWEAKAMAVLRCMSDPNLVIDAVLEIMFKAVVPWSDSVESLVQEHLEMEHPKQELLRESYCLMEMKKLLRRYGIRNLNISSAHKVMTLVRHILKQDLPTSLDDSLSLAEAYKLDHCEIYFLYCHQQLTQSKPEECMLLLKRLATADAEVVIARLVTWARFILQEKQLTSAEKQQQMLVAQVTVEMLNLLQNLYKDNMFMKMRHDGSLKMFMIIAHLQEQFDIFLSPDEYEDPQLLKRFKQQVITAYENTKAWRHLAKKSSTAPPTMDDEKVIVSASRHGPDVVSLTKTISTEAGPQRLAQQLQLSEQEVWTDMAHRALEVGKVEKALKILSDLYLHHPNSSTGVVLLHTTQKLCQMLEDDVPMVLPERFNLPAVIHQLACQAATVCHSDQLLDCLELCKSTRSAADVYRQCQMDDDYGFTAKASSLNAEQEAYTESSFQDSFSEDGIVLDPVSVLPVQYRITTRLLPLFSDSRLFPLDCACLSNCAYKEDRDLVEPLMMPLATMLQSLQECSQLELALRLQFDSYGSIVQHLLSNNMNLSLSTKLYDGKRLLRDKQRLTEIGKATFSNITVVTASLLQKVLNWRVVDCDLAVGLCTLLSRTEVLSVLWKSISSAWQNYDKIRAVAVVGAHLCSMYQDQEEREKFLSVITDAEWGIRLGRLGVSIQSVFRLSPETKKNLIPVLVKNRSVTPELILEYCRTFGLNSDQALNLFITTLLLQEEGGGSAEMEVVEPLELALQIIPKLSCPADLVISLNMAITKISPYSYERIERVLQTIQMADEGTTIFPLSQMIGLLQHLKSYKRISPPSDVEKAYMLENSLEITPLTNTCLPFHLLLQTNHFFWKIISPEISEETFPTLLLISKLMKVNEDKLHMLAVNHVFEKKLKPLILEQAKRGQGHGSSREKDRAVKTIRKYTLCIQNLELAAATIHKIGQELPAGMEKTSFLKFCLELAHKLLKTPGLEEEVQARGETIISKMQLQFQRSAIENLLVSTGLDSPDLLKLTGVPGRLVVALFEHRSIEERMKMPAGQIYPDIHAVAKEIASISSVDLLKIRNVLLEKWICKSDSRSIMDPSCQDCVLDLQADPDLMRVVYLLQMHPVDLSARLLSPVLTASTWPLGGSGLRLTFEHRSRALLCLVRMADATMLETLLRVPRSEVSHHIKCYLYLSQLEALNTPYTLELFLSSPKEGMIKGLWKNHSHEPQAVRLVADLALEYQVYDLQLWNGILQKLLVFNMISYLQKLLSTLGGIPCLWEVASFSRTWRSVILAPFVSASVPLTPQQKATFYRTFVLLLKFPFLFSLDLVGIAKRFVELGMLAYSLGALLLIPSAQKREQQICCFLSSCDPVLILDQVKDVMSTGELAGVPSQVGKTSHCPWRMIIIPVTSVLLKVMGAVFKHLCKMQQYEKLLTSQHLHDLLHFLVSRGHMSQVQELLEHLLSRNNEEDAARLVQMFLNWSERKGGNPQCPDSMKEFFLKMVEERQQRV
ncbi:kinetochore-associated protein 1 isoform X2 [Denticeps clupeoides]|uniref:kinetochore-associated protein 1 isoform X2 n=1 Tax=Denticeps clupeoides TaxID=299321 RepID=UPI0010A54D4A|nr:kinetochore-associated protein 1 isoform X2 [Denticeps clupeoides]